MITIILKYKSTNLINTLLLYLLWIVSYYKGCYLEFHGIGENVGFSPQVDG